MAPHTITFEKHRRSIYVHMSNATINLFNIVVVCYGLLIRKPIQVSKQIFNVSGNKTQCIDEAMHIIQR